MDSEPRLLEFKSKLCRILDVRLWRGYKMSLFPCFLPYKVGAKQCLAYGVVLRIK